MNFTTYFNTDVTQNVTEGSWNDIECDWDEFVFENDLEARKQSFKDNLQLLKSMAEELDFSEGCNDLGENKNKIGYCKEINEAENILTRSKQIKIENKKIREDIQQLTVQSQSLQQDIKELQIEESRLRNEYKQHKRAYQKAYDKYSTHFDLDVTVMNISETVFEASVRFISVKDMAPIKLLIDRSKREVIEFCTNKILTENEEKTCKEQYGSSNIPGLLCAVRDIIVNKKKSVI